MQRLADELPNLGIATMSYSRTRALTLYEDYVGRQLPLLLLDTRPRPAFSQSVVNKFDLAAAAFQEHDKGRRASRGRKRSKLTAKDKIAVQPSETDDHADVQETNPVTLTTLGSLSSNKSWRKLEAEIKTNAILNLNPQKRLFKPYPENLAVAELELTEFQEKLEHSGTLNFHLVSLVAYMHRVIVIASHVRAQLTDCLLSTGACEPQRGRKAQATEQTTPPSE